MVLFPKFDLRNGYPVDYMHNTALGVTKLLIDFWLGNHRLCAKSPYFKPLAPRDRNNLDKRLLLLKPCAYITRKPRSLKDRSYYKAVEYRYLLLFYLRFGLQGLLDHEKLKHFELLSASVYFLLQSEISKKEIEEAKYMLNKFATDFEKLYGREAVTMNIHLLRHVADAVVQCGPLWAYSMFGFEKNLGNLKKAVKNPTDALDSITFEYCMSRKENEDLKESISMTKNSRLKQSQLTSVENSELIGYGLIPSPNNGFEISHSCKINRDVYTSLKSPITKSIDYFLQINKSTIGCAQLYVKSDNIIYVLLKIYEVIDKHHHLNRIRATEQYNVFKCSEIDCKLIYMKFGTFEIIAKEPNFFETS